MRGDDGLYVFWWSWRKISVDGQHPNPVGGLFCRSEGSEPSAREDSSARRSDHGYDQVLKAFLEAVVSDSQDHRTPPGRPHPYLASCASHFR